MRIRFFMTALSLVCVLPISVDAETTSPSFDDLEKIDVQRMMKDIKTLSHENYEGRQAGTIGGQKSADFVISRFKHLGLVPAGEFDRAGTTRSWVQQQSLSAAKLLGPTVMELSNFEESHGLLFTPKLGTDFLPILDSPSANITAPAVFVGYGIDDSARGINDYEGLTVQNRIVMFLRGKPTTYSRWVTHAEKEETARKHGAVGFITLTGPILNRYEARRGLGQTPLAMYSSSPEEHPLPGIWISGKVGKALFESQGLSLRKIQNQLNHGKPHLVTELGTLTHLRWNTTTVQGKLINVLGRLRGMDPILHEEVIVIGAHRDHFGEQAGLLFSGADDNASGTALLLEIARIMAETKSRPKRTMVFASFDGEERGLLGSKLYVRDPTHPLNTIVGMINIDHVGVGNGKLTVGITKVKKSIGQEAANISKLTDTTKFYGYFPGGDHVPFYEAGVPTVTVVSSGPHASFHQPSDTVKTIQPEILKIATRYVLAITMLLANR